MKDDGCYKRCFELHSEVGRGLEEGIIGDRRVHGAIAVVGQMGHGLSVVGRDEGEMPPTTLCRAGSGRCSRL